MSNFIGQAQAVVVLVGIIAAFAGDSLIPLFPCVIIAMAVGQVFGKTIGRRRR